jgi:hypothetical protein
MHRPLRVRLASPLAAVLLAAVVLLGAAEPAAATFYRNADWNHIVDTLAAFKKHPPSVPVVYLLGGSAARESITYEPNWTAQISAMGGGRVRALDFGSSSQSFKNDIEIINNAPDVPSLVLIGLNVGRYTSIPPKTLELLGRSAGWLTTVPPEPLAARATRAARGSVYDPHRFHVGQQLSDAAKLGIVRDWLVVKYPRFRQRYAGDYAELRALIALCQKRGFYPVLLELPANLRIIGHAWDGARDRYRRGARTAAADFGIPYEDFVARIGLVSSDFVDVAHLVEPGRAKYQRRLSRLVVSKLKQYRLAAP